MKAISVALSLLMLVMLIPSLLQGAYRFCDSCGEPYTTEHLTEMDYGNGWHGDICDNCRIHWKAERLFID